MEKDLEKVATALLETERTLEGFLRTVPLDDRAIVKAKVDAAVADQQRLLAWCVGYAQPKPFDPDLGQECFGPAPEGEGR